MPTGWLGELSWINVQPGTRAKNGWRVKLIRFLTTDGDSNGRRSR